MRATATKSGRLELQKYQFESLKNQGYSRENYGDLSIFTMTDSVSTWLKAFRGTASKEILFKRYRTEEQSAEAIKNLKASHDRRKAYKAELKANPIKSCAANCATAIREELKKTFPNVKFKVTSQNFSMGDSVHVTWTNGPTYKQVEDITRKYQSGHFDGMTDMYEYSNTREDLPQSKYVQTRREITEEINTIVFEGLEKVFAEGTPADELRRYAYKIIQNSAIPVGAIVTGLEKAKQSGLIEECYSLKISLDETQRPQPKETPNFEAVEVPAGEIQIIDYSAKAIAVIGETKPIKDKLKELGGKFNFNLSCGAGWIFPKTKLEELQNFLSGGESKEEDFETNEDGFGVLYSDFEQEEAQEAKEKDLQLSATNLHDEVKETINFLADLDVKMYGEVSESVREREGSRG